MYEIPAKYLELQINPKTKLPYYTFDKESLEKSVKKLYKGEKIESYKNSINRIRDMINNPFLMTLLNTTNENDKRKIIRDMIMVDANALNSEISRLLKLNPAYIGTKHMKKLMELSDNYREMFEILKPNQEPKDNVYNDHNNKSNEINESITVKDTNIKGNEINVDSKISVDNESIRIVEKVNDKLSIANDEYTFIYHDLYYKYNNSAAAKANVSASDSVIF